MPSKPKIKDLQSGKISCPGCSEDIHIQDYEPLSVVNCPDCDAPVFIPLKIKNYWLYKPLGGGGMGSVYRALTEDGSGECAVKILPREQKSNPELISSITKEGEIGKILGKAPNISEVVDYGCVDDEYFLASRFAKGTRLDIFISTASRLSERQALDILLQVIDAEIHIINCGFFYRDIKPENIIILDDTASVKLFDFGLCLSLEQAANPDPSDALEGSPYYLPPERIVAAPEGEHSEIYSLGMLLFHMLAGTTYFSQSDIKKLLTKHVGSLRVASVSNRLKHCSSEICTILDKMIKRDPNQRYHELLPLKTELEELCSGAAGYSLSEDISSDIPPVADKQDNKKRKKSTALVVLLVILFTVAAAVGGWHFMNMQIEKSRKKEIRIAEAKKLGVDPGIKHSELSAGEVNKLIESRYLTLLEKRKAELPLFNEAFEISRICKQLSISVSFRKTPSMSVGKLNKMADQIIQKEIDRKAESGMSLFSEKKNREKIAKRMGIDLPVQKPDKSIKDIQKIIDDKADKQAREKYSTKQLAGGIMKIMKKLRGYRVGEIVTILDQSGLQIKGTYKGREGDKIMVGTRKIMISDIIPSERIKFNTSLCASKAAAQVKVLKRFFKSKRKQFAEKYKEKIAPGVFTANGYIKENNKWRSVYSVMETNIDNERKKFQKQQILEKRRIGESIKKSFNREKFIREHGYRKIDGKWYAEKVAVDMLLKRKKDAFDKKHNEQLARLKKQIRLETEKKIYKENGYIYINGSWQEAADILDRNTEHKYLLTK